MENKQKYKFRLIEIISKKLGSEDFEDFLEEILQTNDLQIRERKLMGLLQGLLIDE